MKPRIDWYKLAGAVLILVSAAVTVYLAYWAWQIWRIWA